MKLLTQEILHQFYVTGVQEDSPDPLVIAKFFCPWNQWTWYATEYHPSSRTFFGITVGFETERGYFALDELESVQGPGWLTIERDLFFKPTKLSELSLSSVLMH